jgi:hypothetical protein
MIFVRPPFPPKFLAFHSALPIDKYLPFAPFRIISLLPFFLPINFLMYRYASRCLLCNIRRRLSNIAKSSRIDATRLAYRYIRKLVGRKKGRREIMQNGREGGERQIFRHFFFPFVTFLFHFLHFPPFFLRKSPLRAKKGGKVKKVSYYS